MKAQLYTWLVGIVIMAAIGAAAVYALDATTVGGWHLPIGNMDKGPVSSEGALPHAKPADDDSVDFYQPR